MYKLEISIERDDLTDLMDLLTSHRVEGYTVIDVREGKGSKQGITPILGLSEGTGNAYLFVVCDDAKLNALLPPLRALIQRHKGFAFVTRVEFIV